MTNVHTCTDSITHDVVIDGYYAVYVPNTFTPDGDGVNDLWRPMIKAFALAGALPVAPRAFALRLYRAALYAEAV